MAIKTSGVKARIISMPNSDLKVVNAARVSFAKQVSKLGTGDEGLIRFLANHAHWTPFSHCRDTFAIGVNSAERLMDLMRFFRFDLDQAAQASMVVAIDESVHAGYKEVLYIRHSLYGWAGIVNILAERVNSIPEWIPAGISQYLQLTYPISSKYLLTEASRKLAEKAIPNQFLPTDHIEQTNPEFTDVTMYESVPIFVARQRFKHMIGTTYNEVSRRYVDDEPEFFVPDDWRGRPDKSIKQGSAGIIDRDTLFTEEYTQDSYNEYTRTIYEYMLSKNVAPEQARMVLPQSMMTEYYVTANITAWDRFFKQRMEGTAQLEIQNLAVTAYNELVKHGIKCDE